MRNRRDEYLEDQEEHFQTMRDRLQMAAGMSNFFSVVLGVVVILLLVLLIVIYFKAFVWHDPSLLGGATVGIAAGLAWKRLNR